MVKRLFFWFCAFLVSLLVMVQPARASGVVQAVTSYTCYSITSPFCPNPATGTAAYFQASCSAINATNVFLENAWGYNYVCQRSTGTNIFGIKVPVSSCPPNSTGTPCTCTDPYIPNAGATACVMPSCPANGTTASSGTFDIGIDPERLANGIISGCGANNCATSLGYMDPPNWRAKIAGVYHYYSIGVIVFTGQNCTAGVPSVPSTVNPATVQQSCASGQVGVMSTSGVLNCYADNAIVSASAPVATMTSTATSTTTTIDQATGASSVSTTTTIEEATTTGAGASGAYIQGVPSDLQDYCQRNPSAEVCKPADKIELGDAPTAETLPTENPSFSVSSVTFASAANCPAPVTFEITGLPFISKSYSISWQPFCDIATTLRPIFLAIAAITAAFIFAGVTI